MKSTFERRIVSIAMLVLLTAMFVVSVPAQTASTGVITGSVRDQSGAVVAGATVTATNKGTGVLRRTTTSESGTYELAQLVPGEYTLEVSAGGFARYVQETVTVNVLQRTTVDPQMTPAGATEQVTVTGESAPLVETTKTDVSGVVDKREMENLPVNGRSFAALAPLIPGATLQGSFDPTKARTGTFSIGGSTGRNLNITIDGGDDKDNAVGGVLQNFTMEGIQEFALSTQRFSAANGRSGGALLSIVSKSGTNKMHGTGFGFFRDDALNKSSSALLASVDHTLFTDPADIIKPPFDREQFGGSIGGPIIKDKLFWFGSAEHTRERGNSIVPTYYFDQISLLAPLGYKPVKLLPQPFDDTQFTVKVDAHPNEFNSFSFRYAGQNNKSVNDQAGFLIVATDNTDGDIQVNDLHNFLGSWTWTANPHIVNQFIYQWSTNNNQIVATSNIPNLTFTDGTVVGRNGNVPQQTLQRKHQFRDDLTWNRGNHSFKFGADFVYEPVLGGLFAFLSAPEYDFVDTISNILTDHATYPQGLNTPGVVGDILIAGGNPKFDLRDGAKEFSGYAQDDWKISPRLTLNLGVRYDVDLGYFDAGHQQDNRVYKFLKILGNPYANGLVHDDKNNFSPRVGFAWDITGSGRSVLRGGYGIYYDSSFLNVPLFAVQQANPEMYAFIADTDSGLSLATPTPSFPNPLLNPPIGAPVTGRLLDPNFEAPYTQQWNVGYAQQIGKDIAIEFDYTHILGLHEFTQLDINPRIGPLIGDNRNSPSPSRLLAPTIAAHAAAIIQEFGQATPFSGIRVAQTDGRSRYDAFTASFTKRYSSHFQFHMHYTLSRSVAWFGQTADFGAQPQNPFNKFDPAADFGYTGSDERHRFVATGIFDLKWGIQIAPIFQAMSARPYSEIPSCACDINKDGVTNDRETRDGNDQHKLAPDTLRGDNFVQLNLRASKYFTFKETMKLGLFFEMFNVFNTGNFGNSFDGTVGSPTFKQPTNFFGATGFSEPIGIPFQAQFGFRFSF